MKTAIQNGWYKIKAYLPYKIFSKARGVENYPFTFSFNTTLHEFFVEFKEKSKVVRSEQFSQVGRCHRSNLCNNMGSFTTVNSMQQINQIHTSEGPT